MNKQIFSKLASTGILGVFVGWAIGGNHVKDAGLGRAAFMTRAGVRWDKYYSNPHSMAFYIFEWIIILAILLATYELLVFCVFKFLTLISTGSEKGNAS